MKSPRPTPALFSLFLLSCLPCLVAACSPATESAIVGPEGETLASVAVLEESYGGVNAGDEAQAPDDTQTPDEAQDGFVQDCIDSALDLCETAQAYWKEGNVDGAMEALDQAYQEILKVDPDSDPKLVQQKEDLRFMISKRILEIYASRATAVKGNYKEIPLVLNKDVETEIRRFQGPDRRFFLESYRRSGKYRPMIAAALREAGLPEELSWLPLIESGFKVRALSRARALGLWQFIPSTGYKFGLKRDLWVDERLDPEKSTQAAIKYLKALHQIFGDWTTVLAAYNCGEGTVLRVIRHQKINYLDNFWDLYYRLPRETARYVPRFLAALHILKDPDKYGFDLGAPDPPSPYEVVPIEKQVKLSSVARELGVAAEDLYRLNPELRYEVTPAAPYKLKVPPGTGSVLLARIDQIPRYTPPKRAYAYHRVRPGETLSTIAQRYRTRVSAIVRANNIRRRHLIRVGQRLRIPLRGTVARRPARRIARASLRPDGTYRVRRGDSLWLIARRFNTTTQALQKLNNLETTQLRVGQILRVTPGERLAEAAESNS
ncbi:lytic transglycosylase domain-containing protein [Dissulfurirhabdus thermomarina]|uniref:lytic transglycosylase domain-containing protein n=1 Tax=Dissulfurirhabdus thermomarina TaxID=1765737 RepID=UPI001FE3E457|nr:lytic transglycosylase domain-containing protein [Dissulfurirhabdus thermomarina]